MVRHCISCAAQKNSDYAEIEYLELHKKIDQKIQDLFLGIDLSSENNQEQIQYAIECIKKLRLKKPVRIVKPSSNSRTALASTVIAYTKSRRKPEFMWVCLKCSQNTDEVENPFFVLGPLQNHGVF
jgi:hypothetical protein